MKNDLPNRKGTRLQDFDYSKHGAYFITICTEGKRHILSEILPKDDINTDFTSTIAVGEGFPLPHLTIEGEILDKWIKNIPEKYPTISVDRYVIMPNHIHLLLFANLQLYPITTTHTTPEAKAEGVVFS